jgi:hypothetical protein
MNVLITIPIELYNGLLSRCQSVSDEYTLLKTGVITNVSDADGDYTVVNIRCEPKSAEDLLAWAKKLYPEASSEIVIDFNPKP